MDEIGNEIENNTIMTSHIFFDIEENISTVEINTVMTGKRTHEQDDSNSNSAKKSKCEFDALCSNFGLLDIL